MRILNEELILNCSTKAVLNELNEYGKLLGKDPLTEGTPGKPRDYYAKLISLNNPDLDFGIVDDTVESNFTKIKNYISPAIKKPNEYINPNPLFAPEFENQIIYAFITRFCMFFLNYESTTTDHKIPVSRTTKANEDFYPIFISLLQYYGTCKNHWTQYKENMLEIIDRMLPFIKSSPELSCYRYWLDLFLPDTLFNSINELEKIYKKSNDSVDRRNIRYYENDLIHMRFNSLKIQDEYYSRITPLLIEYFKKTSPNASSSADIQHFLEEKGHQEQMIDALRKLYLAEDSSIYDKFSNSKNTN